MCLFSEENRQKYYYADFGERECLDKAGQEVTQATPTCIDTLASASRVLGLEETHHHIWFILQSFKSKEIYLVSLFPQIRHN